MNGHNQFDLEVAAQLGALTATIREMREQHSRDTSALMTRIGELEQKEERMHKRMKRIEEKLSLGRFVWLTLKMLITAGALIIAFKTGDLHELVRKWKEMI